MTESYRKKLIEVALPLEAINAESRRENYIYKGNPSSVHKWWAQRPLATCRAVIFSQLVDDPSSVPEEFPTEESQETERQRIFRIIERLVKWENSINEDVLLEARMEIARSIARDKAIKFNPKITREECLAFLQEHAPPVLDPFCGGGSIPLEAQRLGLRTSASDLNPVAVLTTKALIEIPPKFAGKPPVNSGRRTKDSKNPGAKAKAQDRFDAGEGQWEGGQGLAEDVRYYGQWMRDEAEKRIGHLYPKAKLPNELGGGEATVIAWLWARTVKCPNPACGAQMPLVKSFELSSKKGKETWVRPVVEGKAVRFTVSSAGKPPDGLTSRAGARCVVCNLPVGYDYVRSQGQGGKMGSVLLALAAQSERGRVYIEANQSQEQVARSARPAWIPDTRLEGKAAVNVPLYGLRTHGDLFTPRQLVALTTFSSLVKEAIERARRDAVAAGLPDDDVGIEADGAGARAYAEAVATYLAFAVDKCAEYNCTLVPWYSKEDRPKGLFARQAIPMVWDFAEVNPLTDIGGTLEASVRIVADAVEALPRGVVKGTVVQRDATTLEYSRQSMCACTDPPYYDNVDYADLSDFLYIWLRHSIGQIYRNVCSTLLVPKSQELVASPYRFGGDKTKARDFFEQGLFETFARLQRFQDQGAPAVVYYAFKQTEETDELGEETDSAQTSTGWETMLEGLLRAGFMITGTWPVRSERGGRAVSIGSNALASSIVLVCRPRPSSAAMATRQEFIRALKVGLPDSLRRLQHGAVAPVDLQQAAIGPGMAVFSRYAKVMEAGGGVMTVRTALQIINQVRDEVLSEQETDLDHDTRWCISWFKQHGMNEGPFGEAEVLSRAMNTAVNGLVEAGVIKAEKGKVRLLKREELPDDYDPREDRRPTVWEATQHLIKTLDEGGEKAAAELAKKLGGVGELAKELAYILFEVCNRNGWSQEAIPYNSLVVAWPEISRMAQAGGLERFGVEG